MSSEAENLSNRFGKLGKNINKSEHFTAYPSYKDSGAEWLGELPEHWESIIAKRIFRNIRDTAEPFAEQLAATQSYGVIPQKDFMERNETKVVLALAGTDNFRDVKVDDFVISLRSFQGGIEHSAYDGCVSPAYTVLRNTNEKPFTPRYFKYLLKEASYIAALQSVTTGIREGRTITYEQFASLLLPLPSLVEQTQISLFLDHETTRIDALIEAQQRLIELLKEKRQAVISHAVTKGLNSNVLMKDSGVDWFGEVPAHWTVCRAKFVADVFVPQRNKPDLNELDGIAWVTMDEMNAAEIKNTKLKVAEPAILAAGSRVLKAGAVIASCVGRFGIAAINKTDVIINQQLQAFIPKSINAEYLRIIIELSKSYFEIVGTAATLVYVNKQGFDNLPVLLPSKNEQDEICSYVNKINIQFEDLLLSCTRSIRLLQERRSALISAAVTGKIDVRGWQLLASTAVPTLEQEVR